MHNLCNAHVVLIICLMPCPTQLADASDPSSCSGKIIECSWDSDSKLWVFMRVRTDKSTPNDFNTYKKVFICTVAFTSSDMFRVYAVNWYCCYWLLNQVMQSIRDNITEEDLLKGIDEAIHLPLYIERIQSDIRAHQQTASSQWKWCVIKINHVVSNSHTSQVLTQLLQLSTQGSKCVFATYIHITFFFFFSSLSCGYRSPKVGHFFNSKIFLQFLAVLHSFKIITFSMNLQIRKLYFYSCMKM